MILATGAVHSHLVRQQLRTFTSVNVASGECLDVHYFAVLSALVHDSKRLSAEEALAERHERGLLPNLTFPEAVANYRKAVEDGLLKIMSKMGISVLASYRGGYNFEALGLSRSLVATYFPPMTSRVSGLGLTGIAARVTSMHRDAYASDDIFLPVGGFFRYRRSGERRAFDGQLIHAMQRACDTGSYESWKKYSRMVSEQGPVNCVI